MKTKKLLIGLPTSGNVKPETIKCLYDMKIPEVFDYHELFIASGYGLARARNLIAAKAIDENFDYIFTVDDDMTFPKDVIQRLFEMDADIASAWAMQVDNTTNICTHNIQQNNYRCMRREELPESGVIEVDAMGLACTLIKTSIYSQLNYPYHEWKEYIDRGVLSEDLYLCDRLKVYHGPVSFKVDLSLRAGHIKTYSI